MMGQIIFAEQGSVEWKQARCGHVTASRMADALSILKKGGDSAARKKIKARIIAEILTGEPQDDDIGNLAAVRRGKEFEAQARTTYELQTGTMVDIVGFVRHLTIARFGCSPDGLVGSKGMTEFKVPLPTTHIEYLLAGGLPDDYEPQVHSGLSCNEDRDWCDFMSFCPEMPEHLQAFIVRVPRNPTRIAEIEDGVIEFNGQIDAIVEQLQAKGAAYVAGA